MRPRLTNKEKIQAALAVLRSSVPLELPKGCKSLLQALARLKKEEDERNG